MLYLLHSKEEKRMKERVLKEYFSIPNLMGYFRILLIPVIFIPLYSGGDNGRILYGWSCAACFFPDRSF